MSGLKSEAIWFLLVCACFLSACQTPVYPSIDELLVEVSVFPAGWKAVEPDWTHPPQAPWSGRTSMIEYISQDFYSVAGKGAVAGEEIRQFDSPQAAAEEYRRRVAGKFQDTEWSTPWTMPVELSFESVAANQYRYACSIAGEGELAQPQCVYIAQYGVYVVYFGVAIYDTTAITYADLDPIFEAIDERFIQDRGE